MKKFYTIIFFVIFAMIIISIQHKEKVVDVLAKDFYNNETTLETAQQAIIDTAYAYYYQGTGISYDSYPITFQLEPQRKQRGYPFVYQPELANEQNIHYTACSAFAYQTYSEAFTDENGKPYLIGESLKTKEIFKSEETSEFGYKSRLLVRMGDPSSDYYNEKIAVYYLGDTKDNIVNNQEGIKTAIKNILQPGDIIAYERGKESDSHVVLYLGGDDILNSVGSSYNYTNKKDVISNSEAYGSIRTLSLENSLLSDKNGYLFCGNVNKITILRPLNEILADGSKYHISDRAKVRMTHNKLARVKIASVNAYDSVNPGDEITYTIKLINHSGTAYNNIEVTDQIPANTTLKEAPDFTIREGSKLSWTINLANGSQSWITYTVRVNNDNKLLGKKIISSETVVDGIKMNTIETLVAKTLTKTEQEDLVNKVKKNIGSKYTSSEQFLKEIYSINFDTPENILSNLFSHSEIDLSTQSTHSIPIQRNGDTGKKDVYVLKSNLASKYGKMFVPGLFGGIYAITERDTAENPIRSDERNRTFKSDTFMIGDILVMHDDDYENDSYTSGKEKDAYLYLGNNEYVTVKDSSLAFIDSVNGFSLTDSLLAQNAFVVLRPSMSLVDVDDNSQAEPKEEPTTTAAITVEQTTTKVIVTTATEKVENPATGVSNYLAVLSIVVISIGILYYFIDKKEIFR